MVSAQVATELGQPIPLDTQHAVSVCFPTWKSVISYVEKDPKVLGCLKSGYPRFWIDQFPAFSERHSRALFCYIRVLLGPKPSFQLNKSSLLSKHRPFATQKPQRGAIVSRGSLYNSIHLYHIWVQ